MSTSAEISVGLTYAEVQQKMRAKDWLEHPLADFSTEELERLVPCIQKLENFSSDALLGGRLGPFSLAPVALVFHIFRRHPALASARTTSPEMLPERYIDKGLKLFLSYVEQEISSRRQRVDSGTAFETLIDGFEKILSSE